MPRLSLRGFSRRDLLKGIAATGIGAATGTLAHGYLYERHHLGLTRETLHVVGLPPALSGLRIGFLTDFHRSETVSHEIVARAVQMVMAEAPEMIVLGGDYVTWGDRRFVGPAADALAPLAAPHGVFAILGNHDDDRDMPSALARNHFVVLKDQVTRVSLRGETLDLIGIRFWTRRASDITRVMKRAGETSILLAHDPRRLTEAAALDIPAVLSGHTHGGQVVLPGLGAIARRKFPVVAGLARQENTSLFVSRGIGTVYVPMRINCPPEVALVTLRRLSDI